MIWIMGQDAYGPSNKPELGLSNGVLQGYVYSARSRGPGDRCELRERFDEAGIALFDPKLFFLGLPEGSLSNLPSWPYWQDLTRRRWRNAVHYIAAVESIVEAQRSLGFRNITVGGPVMSGFDSAGAALTESAVTEASNHVAENERLFAAVTVSSVALGGAAQANETEAITRSMAEWLDGLTAEEFDGVYLVIDWENTDHQLPQDPVVLSNWMYIIHALSEINRKMVVVGYTDLSSILAMAAGACGVATGWYLGNRRLSTNRYSGSGGRRAYRRLWLEDCLATIREDHLDELGITGVLSDEEAASDTAQTLAAGDPVEHIDSPPTEVLHNWGVLHKLKDNFEERSTADRVQAARMLIQGARAFHANDMSPTAKCPDDYFSHYARWEDAIRRFEQIARISP